MNFTTTWSHFLNDSTFHVIVLKASISFSTVTSLSAPASLGTSRIKSFYWIFCLFKIVTWLNYSFICLNFSWLIATPSIVNRNMSFCTIQSQCLLWRCLFFNLECISLCMGVFKWIVLGDSWINSSIIPNWWPFISLLSYISSYLFSIGSCRRKSSKLNLILILLV